MIHIRKRWIIHRWVCCYDSVSWFEMVRHPWKIINVEYNKTYKMTCRNWVYRLMERLWLPTPLTRVRFLLYPLIIGLLGRSLALNERRWVRFLHDLRNLLNKRILWWIQQVYIIEYIRFKSYLGELMKLCPGLHVRIMLYSLLSNRITVIIRGFDPPDVGSTPTCSSKRTQISWIVKWKIDVKITSYQIKRHSRNWEMNVKKIVLLLSRST